MVTKKDTQKKTTTSKKPAAKKTAAKSTATKTTAAKKADVKKAEPKKTEAFKAAPKKPAAKKVAKVSKNAPVAHAVGRRKKSVARVWFRKGTGVIRINEREFKEYFDTDLTRIDAAKPFEIVPEIARDFDIDVTVSGGGTHAQSGATKLAIARALVTMNEAMRPLMRKNGLLTVDSRVKERKKYGQKAARRKFQFVKR
jgi:small subunit ribosomal protein S9